MKILILPLVGFIMLKFCIGIRLDEECQIHPNRYVKNTPRPLLFLMPLEDERTQTMNIKLLSWCQKLGFKVGTVIIPPKCISNHYSYLDITKMLIRQQYDVINLKVNVPANYFLNEMGDDDSHEDQNGLSPVGHSYVETYTESVQNCTIDDKIDGTEYENCKVTEVTNNKLYAKLISTSLKSYKLLFEILKVIDKDYDARKQAYWAKYVEVSKHGPIKAHTIVICSNTSKSFGENTVVVNNCENVNDFAEHDVLAVLAPKPFKKEEITYLPVIFTDVTSPYLMPDMKAIYPSSTTLYRNYFNEMAERLMQFLQLKNWKKVAIVSDNSLYSSDFEELMTKQFQESNMVYSVQQCSGFKCEFDKPLSWLKKADAKIIIANVDEKYAMKLVKSAERNQLTAAHGVLWIFRGWPFQKSFDPKGLKEMLYINYDTTVSPMLSETTRTENQIKEALTYIKEVVAKKSRMELFLKDGLRTRSRALINDIEKLLKHLDVNIYKVTLTNTITTGLVFSANKIEPIKIPYKDQDCSLKSNSFDGGCQDWYPLFIMLAILLILLAVLCFVIFYGKWSLRGGRGRRYRPFK